MHASLIDILLLCEIFDIMINQNASIKLLALAMRLGW